MAIFLLVALPVIVIGLLPVNVVIAVVAAADMVLFEIVILLPAVKVACLASNADCKLLM